jgi:hypothetical protein
MAKSSKKNVVTFIGADATEDEIKEFVRILNEGDTTKKKAIKKKKVGLKRKASKPIKKSR